MTEKAINEYYQANQSKFSSAAQVKLEYIEIQQKALADNIEISEQDLFEAYEEEAERYQTQELRQADHILFKLSEDATDDDVELAFEKAQLAIDRLADGDEFGLIANDLSDDKLATKNNGNLGLLSRTDIDNPEFVTKLFNMGLGQTSDAIRTKLGVQIVKLGEIVASTQKSFEQVKSQIEGELRAQHAQTEFVQQAELLQELSYEYEDNLEKAAETLEVEVKLTEWLNSDSFSGIAAHPKVRVMAFSDEVLNKRYNSDLIELDDGHVVVIRVVEHQEAQIQSLDIVSPQIEAVIAKQTASQGAVNLGNQLISQLQMGDKVLADVAKTFDTDLMSATAVKRDERSVAKYILQHAFEIKGSDTETYSGAVTSDDGFVVIRLNTIEQPEDNVELSVSDWVEVQGQYGRREMNSMLKALRETRDVTLYPENL